MVKVLVYGEQDLNLVDGSSVWQASVVEVLAGVPDATVDVLLRTPIHRDILVGDLRRSKAVTFLDPWCGLAGCDAPREPRLTAEQAALYVDLLCEQHDYDAILLRAPKVAQALLRAPATLGRCWIYLTSDNSLVAAGDDARCLLGGAQRVLCQTPEVRDALRDVLDVVPDDRVTVLPPMIRPWTGALPRREEAAPLRLCYSGKFSADYKIEEIVAAFVQARAVVPALELHVFGDKFHGDDAFRRRVQALFTGTPGLTWHGAKPRHLVNEALSSCHVGVSWRSEVYDDSLEFSTKVLEYATLGLPVLLNPTPIQRRVFGDDYSCYVASEADFVGAIQALAHQEDVFSRAQLHVRAVAEGYGFPSATRTLGSALAHDAAAAAAQPRRRVRRVLIAGHDLKFVSYVERYFREHCGDRIELDVWRGHEQAETPERRRQAERADVIWCEWCLGNAVYYSQRKRPDQRLVVRLHAQEINLPFRQRVDWRRVDALVSICPPTFARLRADLGERGDIVRYVPNLIDAEGLAQPKLPGDEFRLGLLGFAPRVKRPDLALDLLEQLRRSDSRYSLSIKGRPPWDYDWLWSDQEERRFYEAWFERVRSTPGVHFEGFGEVRRWFRGIGVILSVSDAEGSHQAVAEGMASGCVPCIRGWDGANQLYPPDYVFDDLGEAADMIVRHRADHVRRAAACRDFARSAFDYRHLYAELDALFAEKTT